MPTLIGQGSFAKHVVVHRSSLVKVDSSLDLRTIAPLGCGLMTGAGAVINYLKPKAGTSILICGMGAVGFGALVAARQSGCSNIIAVDCIENRLQMAKEFGATHTIDTSKTADLVFEIKSVCGALDFGYDSTGNAAILSAMSQSLHANAIACGVGGGVLQGFNWQTIDEGFAVPQELIPKMIDWYKSGDFPIEKLVKFYPFKNVNEAMTAMRNGTVIKPILVM